MNFFRDAAAVLLFDPQGGRRSFRDTPHHIILRVLFAFWFVMLFRRFIWESLTKGRYSGGDLQHGDTRARKMTTAHKIVSSFMLVVTGFVLLDGFCGRKEALTQEKGNNILFSTEAVCTTSSSFLPASILLLDYEQSSLAPRLEQLGQLWTESIAAMSFGALGETLPPTGEQEGRPKISGSGGTTSSSLGYAHFICLGLIFGFCGDVALVYRRANPKTKSKGKAGPLLTGIFFFALGHLSYIFAFRQAFDILKERNHSSLDVGEEEQQLAALTSTMNGLRCLFYPIGLVAWLKSLYGGSLAKTSLLGWIGGLYTILIAETAVQGTILSFLESSNDHYFSLLAIGLLLFMVSDIGVARSAFKGQIEVFGGLMHISDFIWATYGPAQCLIAFSTHALFLSLRREEES